MYTLRLLIIKLMSLFYLWAALLVFQITACDKEEEKTEEESDTDSASDDDEDDDDDDNDEDEEDGPELLISQTSGTSYHRTSSSTPLAQSFTTEEAFSLTKVSLFVSNTNGSVAHTLNVIITKGGANPAAGTRVSDWIVVDSTHAVGQTGWVDFELAEPLDLVANTIYWIEAWPDPSEQCDLMEDTSAPYSGGTMLRMDFISSNWVSTQESGQPVLGDMKFRVYGE